MPWEERTSGADAEKALIPTPETCEARHRTQGSTIQVRKTCVQLGFDESHAHVSLAATGSYRRHEGLRWLPQNWSQNGSGDLGVAKTRPRLWDGILRRLSHTSLVLGPGGTAAPGSLDLPHGFRSPPMGDVFGLGAWAPGPAEAIANLARVGRCTHMPNVPYAGGESFGQ